MLSSKIIISNGHSRFFLINIIHFFNEDVSLKNKYIFISSLYPKKIYINLLKKFKKINIIERFIKRKEGVDINEKRIINILPSELIHQIAVFFYKKYGNILITDLIAFLAMFVYRVYVCFYLLSIKEKAIYHYRSGYGGVSIKVAKFKKMYCICDHSIANPLYIEQFINNQTLDRGKAKLGFYWNPIIFDIENSDLVICNSNFVDKTIKLSNEKINTVVVYNGLDKVISKIKNEKKESDFEHKKTRKKIIFMGSFDKRKGADDIIEVINKLYKDCDFTIVGHIDKYYVNALPLNVKRVAYISLEECMRYLNESDIFLFPSRAEGSARVVYMAMAAGCLVITTENSGSIIENSKTGYIVKPGDVDKMIAIIKSFNNDEKFKKIRRLAYETVYSDRHSVNYYNERIYKIYENAQNLF